MIKKIKIGKLFVSFMLLAFIIAVSVGSAARDMKSSNQNDTGHYNKYYECLSDGTLSDCQYLIGAPPHEVIVGLSMKLTHVVGLEFFEYCFLVSLFFLTSISYFYKGFLSFAIFPIFVFLLHPMGVEALTNTLRQTVSMTILMLFIGRDLRCLAKGNSVSINFKTIIKMLVLLSSHIVGFIFYLFWLLSGFFSKANSRFVLFLVLSSGVVGSFLVGFVVPYLPLPDVIKFKLMYYSSVGGGLLDVVSQIGKLQILAMLCLIIVYWFFNRSLTNDTRARRLIAYFIVLISLSLFFSFTSISYRILVMPALIFSGLIFYAIERRKDIAIVPLVLYFSIQAFYFFLNYEFNFRAFN